MLLQAIEYWIDDKELGKRKVTGLAIDSGLPVRICIHLHEPADDWCLYWKCCHFDSGLSFGHYLSASVYSASDAVEYAVKTMASAIISGKFVSACEKVGFDAKTTASFMHT